MHYKHRLQVGGTSMIEHNLIVIVGGEMMLQSGLNNEKLATN